MFTCEVCGSNNFEKHAGFMYCAICQTQSQDYHEQEHEFQEGNTVRKTKAQTVKTKRKAPKVYNDGVWTSWEAFNYILHGMTQELRKCEVPRDFETMVLKLWTAYLQECKVAFTSKFLEQMPKLGFNFKQRDARVLYNIDVSSTYERRRRRSRSVSRASNTSNSSISSLSKRSFSKKKSKIIESDYQEHISMLSNSILADVTLESLGRSTDNETLNEEESDSDESLVKNLKEVLTTKDYKTFKSSYKSPQLMSIAKDQARQSIRSVAKNKLLSILHLALLLTGSEIQLSDLLRFIREGHLSYAKVTHFLPKDVHFSKSDFSYIDVISDSVMPTHLKQRKISSQLACFLKIENIPTPNLDLLVERYCHDLNLPDEIQNYGKRIVQSFASEKIVPKTKSLIPSYEAWAMASIIVVLKLLFGLNGKTERFLSHLARTVNRFIDSDKTKPNLFVFEDWQKHLECRKTVLTEFHYPTQEQLDGNGFRSSKKFLDTLMKESKDEHRNERFIPYTKYYIDEKIISNVKRILSHLTKPQVIDSIDFQPCLTPQSSHINTILRKLSEERREAEDGDLEQLTETTKNILRQNFKRCDITFALEPAIHLKFLEEGDPNFLKDFITTQNFDDSMSSTDSNDALFLDCSSKYWTLYYPKSSSSYLSNFKEDVFEKTPHSFQWLMTECSRMLEMNVRDVYDVLLFVEASFSCKEERNGSQDSEEDIAIGKDIRIEKKTTVNWNLNTNKEQIEPYPLGSLDGEDIKASKEEV